MRPILLWAFLAGLAPQDPAPTEPASAPFTQIITAEMIESAGLVRLGELHLLIDGWDYSTIDHVHDVSDAASLSPFRSDGWTLLVDGQQIGMDLQGSKDLNLLPIALHDVDYIEVIEVPTIAAGTLSAHGVIHIHTRSPSAGISLRGSFWLGNETGDDGPYRYLESNTKNVDHTGAEVHSSLSMKSNRNWMRLSEVSVHIPVTDRAIKPRIQGLYDPWPTINAIMLAARIHLESDRSTHDLSAMTSPIEDFIRHRDWGREIPTNTRLQSINANGSVRAGERTLLAYRLGWSGNRMQERANLQDLDYDWNLHILSAGLEAIGTGGGTRRSAGIRYEARLLDTGYDLRERDYSTFGGFVQVEGIGSTLWNHDVGLHLNLDGDDLLLSALLTSHLRINRRNAISGILSAGARSFRQDHPYWYWVDAGYRFLSLPDGSGHREPSRYLTFDLLWRHNQEGGTALDIRGYYRQFTDVTLERSDFTFDPSAAAFSGSTSLSSGIMGEMAGLRVTAGQRISGHLDGSFSFDTRAVISGDDAIVERWDTRPAQLATLQLRYTPVSSFRLFLQASYRSATIWTEYDGAERSGGLYSETIPSHWNIDFTANKWFWNHRVRGSLSIRNLLNQRFRYHPIGATFDLSVFARFEFYLGTLNSSRGN
ncbi:hypothetical protein ACFL41_00880 [Gemmatimonadota bacterium]